MSGASSYCIIALLTSYSTWSYVMCAYWGLPDPVLHDLDSELLRQEFHVRDHIPLMSQVLGLDTVAEVVLRLHQPG